MLYLPLSIFQVNSGKYSVSSAFSDYVYLAGLELYNAYI